MVSSVTGKPVAAGLRRGRIALLAGGAAVALTILTTVSAAASPEVISTVPVGAAPLGVAVSPLTGNVYVSDSGGSTVQVIRGF
jgi:DNA-binding beta-propeller fold protein YncE